MNRQYFKLFSSCIVTKGFTISIICDVQRGNFVFIPEGLCEILSFHTDKTVAEIKVFYLNQHDDEIDEYFEYLCSNDFGFYTNEPDNFPSIEEKFESPDWINNSIIDVERDSNHDFGRIFLELDSLACKFIEIRIFDEIGVEELADILKYSAGMRFSIMILLKFTSNLNERILYEDILKKFRNVIKITVHSTITQPLMSGKIREIVFSKQIITNEACCGKISPKNFTANIEHFTESLAFNTCLNKKISIDKNGNIKNCPSMSRSYGNLKDTSLREVMEDIEFKKYWGIHKDQIAVCKDCQFRRICVDCRAYLDNLYDKPKKCTYDPYKNVWE